MTRGAGARHRAPFAACSLVVLLALLLLAAQLPADDARVSQEPVEGLWLGASLEGALLERDLWAGGSLGIGVEQRRFALHLRVPAYLSLYDFHPRRDDGAPLCLYIRCAEWLDADGGLRVESVSRVVDDLRIGRPGDYLYARAGPVFATLGSGRVLDRYLNSPEHDRRQSGVYAKAAAPFAGLAAELVVGNLFVPQQLVAARAKVQPLLPFVSPDALFGPLLGRLELSADVGLDLTAPRPFPTVGLQALGAGALEASWPLLEEGGLFGFAPFVAAGAAYGLLSPSSSSFGFGTSGGARAELRVPFVALRLAGSAFLDGEGHRTGLFGTLYEIERTRALAGSINGTGGIASVPAPGGLGFSTRGELVLLDVVRTGARFVDDTAPGGELAEAYLEVGFWSLLAGARVIRRGISGLDDVLAFDERTLVVAEGTARIWGPFTAYARWFRTPRLLPGGGFRVDDDVIVGVGADLVLGLGAPDEG